MIAAIEAALQHDVAGDPITGIRWTRRTTEKIATELATLDIQVCPRTVARILKDLDYRLRVNHKRVSAGSGADRELSSYFDNIRHHLLLEKVARRVSDGEVLRLLKKILKANGKKRGPARRGDFTLAQQRVPERGGPDAGAGQGNDPQRTVHPCGIRALGG